MVLAFLISVIGSSSDSQIPLKMSLSFHSLLLKVFMLVSLWFFLYYKMPCVEFLQQMLNMLNGYSLSLESKVLVILKKSITGGGGKCRRGGWKNWIPS